MNIKCEQCRGNRLRKGLTKKLVCEQCNGLGWLKPNMSAYSEFEVIERLLYELRHSQNERYYLQKDVERLNQYVPQGDQHDGRNSNTNYRGD